jgi:integral membrane sensor domain MASE1
MLLFKNRLANNLVVFLVLIIVIYTSFIQSTGDNVFLSFWPAAGFLIAVFYLHLKEVLPGLLLGTIIGYTLAYIFADYHLIIDNSDFVIFVISEFVFVTVFILIMHRFKFGLTFTAQNILNYIGSLIIATFAYASLLAIYKTLIMVDGNFLETYLELFIGHFFGGIFYGTLIFYSKTFDTLTSISRNNQIYASVYVLVFVITSFLIFRGVWIFNYEDFHFLFILLFTLSSFLFSYRMITITSLIYLFMSQHFYISTLPSDIASISGFKLNLFLVVILISVLLIRMVIIDSKVKQSDLSKTNDQLETLINSTFRMLKLGEHQDFKKAFDGEKYLSDLFEVATTIFRNYDRATCYVRGEEFVKFIAAKTYDIDFLNRFQFRIEEFEWAKDIPEHVVDSSKMVRVSLGNKYKNFIGENPELKESIKFTLFIDDAVVGGMSFDIVQGSDKRFTKQDYENMKSFQSIMNNSYQTRYLMSKNNTLRDDIVLSLIRTLELYDQYTGGHSEDVAYLSLEIAKRLGISEEEQYKIFWAGLVHDIGKVGIPSDILNKPGRLSLEEYEQVKYHPVFGYDILRKSPDLQEIALLVKHHHEWWNGAGYPDGIKEKEIPLGAQIIQVSDSVSSMATKRPYTVIKTSNEILSELKLYRGSQFSPDICDEMIKYIEEGLLDIYYSYK